jgi:hypothetical protein
MPKPDGLTADTARQLIADAYRLLIDSRLDASHSQGEEEVNRNRLEELRRLGNFLSAYASLAAKRESKDISATSQESAATFIAAQIFEFLGDYRAIQAGITDFDISHSNTVTITGNELWNGRLYYWLASAAHYLISGHDGNAVVIVQRVRAFAGQLSTGAPIAWEESLLSVGNELTGVVTEIILDILAARFGRAIQWRQRRDQALSSINEFNVNVEATNLVLASSLFDISEACITFAGALTNLERTQEPSGWNRFFERAEEGLRPLQEISLLWLISLLRRAFSSMEGRGLLFIKPSPSPSPSTQWLSYLEYRASRRTLLWETHIKAIQSGYLAHDRNAVISMPTGSGKSFAAELKVAAALERGWVLYLVPTNALARQVEDDLRNALTPFQTTVKRFVTDREFNLLESEELPLRPENYVALMTPEKLRVALSLFPDAFKTCALCVVDEAHLIDESARGWTLEIGLARLKTLSSQIAFLLTSAMINKESTDDLAGWLGGNPIFIRWQPGRQVYMLGIPNEFGGPSKTRTSKADLLLASVYRSDWEPTSDNLRFLTLPESAIFETKVDGRISFKAAETARKFAEFLIGSRIKTLLFTPQSDAQSSAKRLAKTKKFPEIHATELDLWERVLSKELGRNEPEIVSCLRDGVGYHQATMLTEEQRLCEYQFRENPNVLALVATGTLSQGVNLPAEAVVFAGNSRHDVESNRTIPISTKDFANIAGRAGRSSFANQGLIALIPNWRDFQMDALGKQFMALREQYLAPPAIAYGVGSALDRLLDQISKAVSTSAQWGRGITADIALSTLMNSLDENDELSTVLTTWLGESPNQQLLKNTYAYYLAKKRGEESVYTERISGIIAHWVRRQNETFPLTENETLYFQRSGLPSWVCQHLLIAARDFSASQPVFADQFSSSSIDFQFWLERILPQVQTDVCKFFFRSRVGIGQVDKRQDLNLVWRYEQEALFIWLSGGTVEDLAKSSFSKKNNRRGDSERDIATKFVNKTTGQYAYAVGSFLYFLDCVWREQDVVGRPWGQHASWEPHLANLSLAIKWGVSSISALAWILEGIRFRFAANTMGKIFPGEDLEERRRFARTWIKNSKPSYDPQKREDLTNQFVNAAKQQGYEYDSDFAGIVLDAIFGTDI